MSNPPPPPPRSCWSQCFWCISTCNGRRISSIGPSEPFPVVLVNGQKPSQDDLSGGRRTIQVEPAKSERIPYGVINQFFVPDENGVVATAASSERESSGGITTEFEGRGDGPNEHHLANSIFIEIDKDRRIRVVHLQPPKTNLGGGGDEGVDGSGAASPSSSQVVVQLSPSAEETSSPSSSATHRKSVPEEEDEYWFSKWTRKPRFRSIFEKNTIHNSTDDNDAGDEGENNNANSNNGVLSKDFEIARAAAAAKRRAWAYNNGSTEPVVVQSTVIDNNEEEEYNSISICESSTKWSKSGGGGGNNNKGSSSSSTEKSPSTGGRGSADGVTNFGFEEEDDLNKHDNEEEEEVIHEMAVDCPPDFVSPVKSLSLKRGTPSPSPSSSSTIVMGKNCTNSSSSQQHQPAILNISVESENIISQNVKKTPILFFIHGISESSEVWTAQMDFFHKLGFEIVAPDLLGHGFSTTPNVAKYYHFESLAQDLLSVYDYFVEDGRKVVILGHGYGASLAAVISRVRPKTCSLLISISGGGPTPLVNRSCCRGSLVPFYCKLFHTNNKAGRFDNPDLCHILPTIIHKHVINGQIWGDGDSGFYRRVSVPTLLVFGMKDKVVNLVEVCEMERTIPKSFLEVIDSAGHLVMIDEPTKLNKMLGKFIQSWV